MIERQRTRPETLISELREMNTMASVLPAIEYLWPKSRP